MGLTRLGLIGNLIPGGLRRGRGEGGCVRAGFELALDEDVLLFDEELAHVVEQFAINHGQHHGLGQAAGQPDATVGCGGGFDEYGVAETLLDIADGLQLLRNAIGGQGVKYLPGFEALARAREVVPQSVAWSVDRNLGADEDLVK